MKLEKLAIADLVEDPANARGHGDKNVRAVAGSLKRFKQQKPIVVDKDNIVIAGNATLQTARALGWEHIWAVRTELTPTEATAYAIADNRTGELAHWIDDALNKTLKALDAEGWDLPAIGFDDDDWLKPKPPGDGSGGGDGPGGAGAGLAAGNLAARFIVPPFSVLDARQGYWQDRKRAWLALGIESEVGRGDNLLKFSDSVKLGGPGFAAPPPAEAAAPGKRKAGKRKGKEEAAAAEPSEAASEEAPAAKRAIPGGGTGANSVYAFKTDDGYQSGPEAQASGSGTSIFDPVLCELAYRWFCPPGGRVLDPFAGGSVRGIVAAKLGLAYSGIELREEQVAANREQGERLLGGGGEPMPDWTTGDSREVLGEWAASGSRGKFDLVMSCPPYADLEVYSDDPNDLSTMPYEAFRQAYRAIIAKAVGLLEADSFAFWVIGEVREKNDGGCYRGFVPDTIAAFEDAGARFYNEAILVTAVGTLPLRAGKIFAASRKLGKTHQNVLVFCKGDPKKACQKLGEIADDDVEAMLAAGGTLAGAGGDPSAFGEIV